ncbi:hypothetical protein Vau01_035760 [Virgisporangium aurantiacum]|uniref:Uncharacterized protein n=1 Tax=Virgisporangium aurantiacum TaxID=175570 RepID=A0A8J3Z6Z4_9ACTN|nr:hypothetical protein Vau01_035760 [Virgisporangium aurantiacum]
MARAEPTKVCARIGIRSVALWSSTWQAHRHRARLHGFFGNTGPTLYFVPLTQLATVLVWVLWA